MRHVIAIAAGTAVVLAPFFALGASPAQLLEGPIVEQLREGQQGGDEAFDHSTFDALVSRHVDVQAGRVDYAAVADARDRLDEYLQQIAAAELETLDGDEQLALLINAYNACTLELIVDHYPEIDSIRDISSPWETPRCDVGGHTLSLDQIEHNVIRPMYRDPRIHFAVNCAAVDCPPLADFAYTGDEIDDQLRRRTERTLSNHRYVRIESRMIFGDRLRYTRVMHWYEDDFLDADFRGYASTVAEYIARHTEREEIRRFVEEHDGEPSASPLGYDWSLNDVD